MVESFVRKWNISSVEIDDLRMTSHAKVIRLGNIEASIKATGSKQSPERHFTAADIEHRTLHDGKMGPQEPKAGQKLQVQDGPQPEKEMPKRPIPAPNRDRFELFR